MWLGKNSFLKLSESEKKKTMSPEKYFQIFDNSLFLLTVKENRYLVYD